jgi:hypothetical protein
VDVYGKPLVFIVSLILAATLAIGAAVANGDIISSPTGNTFCLYQPGARTVSVQCSASDWRHGATRSLYELREHGTARVRTSQGDPGEGDVTARYGQWLYFRGGTARLQGTRRNLRCIFRRTGLTCINADRHGFRVRVGLHERF